MYSSTRLLRPIVSAPFVSDVSFACHLFYILSPYTQVLPFVPTNGKLVLCDNLIAKKGKPLLGDLVQWNELLKGV